MFQRAPSDFAAERLRWIIRLRWAATGSILAAALFAGLTGFFPGVEWRGLAAVGVGGLIYNAVLFFRHRRSGRGSESAAMTQALVDIFILTGVLWLAGGIAAPFVGYYVFHVALIGIVAGPRAAGIAAGVSLGCASLLLLTDLVPALQVARWDPVAPFDRVADVTAFASLIGGIGFIVVRAMRELREREAALKEARDQAALEFQLLSNTLNELQAGLEVVDEDGMILWRNRRADQLAPSETDLGLPFRCRQAQGCEHDPTIGCPYSQASGNRDGGRCRFAVSIDGAERVYEMLSFRLPADSPEDPDRTMNLYVDRTQATLDERRLVTTERLVSLGRVAQGVAHELNTPLATIRTLAADMRVALAALDEVGTPHLRDDLAESAVLIQDETRRLGRITQALLAGGDLVRTQVSGAVPLPAMVERARALVFAGVQDGPSVHIDPALHSVAVTADPDRLVQVLVNLLQNALDAVRGQGDAHVDVSARVEGGRVEIAIEDNGPGLTDDVQQRLFEPFATTKPPGQGTGLGLYTSYMLAQAMGGALGLENRPGGGARAFVRLPRSQSEVRADERRAG